MILTIHNLAETYKCLPSEVLARASTLDLYVMDVATQWRNYQHEQQEGRTKEKSSKTLNAGLSIEQMRAMMERARQTA
ncbi:hypothetical protein UFOVP647_15 [uncultured Caudovirales phage]|jgi:hypothetical protein|uniref:Uncharacterized protein n=1 Tax=uncultured Caudovirales phage TaxID=2100421 RepID=A0A6J5NC84_9CAUD|nr:hypothetical protein UFOVP647_15 [uncultured Caudovirales phage]